MIDFGICSYGNLMGLLNGTLSSIAPIADQILIVNVPFQGYPLDDPQQGIYDSQPLKRHPNIQLVQSSQALTQLEARNTYLELCENDFLCVIDDDEILLKYNIPVLEEELDKVRARQKDDPGLYSVLYVMHNGIPNMLPRVIYKPKRFRYVDNHFHFSIDSKYHGAHTSKSIKGMTLKHLTASDAGRTKEFEKGMERYEVWQLYNEKQTS